MPEEQEIETERLHETIHEPPTGTLLRNIALSTALLAALGAVSSLRAGGTVNEALILKTESTRLQAEASDQWAYYQAKGIKANVLADAAKSSWLAAGKTPPADLDAKIARYTEEQKSISDAAKEKEKERDAKSKEADDLMEQHHRFANAVAFIQIAIALGAVAALGRNRLVWYGSIVVGLIGAALFTITTLH